jgi:hypothetical protein
MKIELLLVLAILTFSCGNPTNSDSEKVTSESLEVTPENNSAMEQDQLKNDSVRNHSFFSGMYSDPYFPDFLVDKLKATLIGVCADIENKRPANIDELYTFTHAATEKINALQVEFEQNDSEIETAAREEIAEEFAFVAEAYGFDADIEELIAPREW